MNPLLVRIMPYLLSVLTLIGLGWYGGWHFGSGRWESKYAALHAQGLAQRLQAEQVARQAIQGQLEAAHAAISRNTQVENELEQKNAAIAADRDHTRDLVNRLLAEAARSAARGSELPEAPDRPPASGAGGASGDGLLRGLLADASDECHRNAARLDALSAEIKPQL